MSGFPILDLVVGMIFIYFLLSIICSSAVEIVLSTRQLRAKTLERWLNRIFDKPITINGQSVTLGQAIMDHCSVTALSGSKKAPAYIDAKNFAAALIEKLTYDPNNPTSIATDMASITKAIEQSPILSTELKRVFLQYASDATSTYQALTVKVKTELDHFRTSVEHWFDTSMDRVGGNFKRKYLRFWTFVIAALVSILLNADSISLAKYLYRNPEQAAKLATDALNTTRDSLQHKLDVIEASRKYNENIDSTKSDSAQAEDLKQNLLSLAANIKATKAALEAEIPLGWQSNPFKYNPDGDNPLFNADKHFSWVKLLVKLVGLFVTVLAIMMGAPFWFDVLNKISNLRSAGKKPESTGSTAQ